LRGQDSRAFEDDPREASAPDNPFDDPPASDNPFGSTTTLQQDSPFEPAGVDYEAAPPAVITPVVYEPAHSVAYEAAAAPVALPPVAYEAVPNPASLPAHR